MDDTDHAGQHFAIMEQIVAALQRLADSIPSGYIQAALLTRLKADLAAHKAAALGESSAFQGVSEIGSVTELQSGLLESAPQPDHTADEPAPAA